MRLRLFRKRWAAYIIYNVLIRYAPDMMNVDFTAVQSKDTTKD